MRTDRVCRGRLVLRQDAVAEAGPCVGTRLPVVQERLRECLGATGLVGWRSRALLAAEIKRAKAAEKRTNSVIA